MSIAAFFSDPHFGHKMLVETSERPFKTVDEMDAALVKNYNDLIGFDDVVIWLGDCFLGYNPERTRHIVTEMAGTKLLIVGNHDATATAMSKMGFSLVMKEANMRISDTMCRLSHYPFFEQGNPPKVDKFQSRRPRKVLGEILLHGHTHSTTKMRDNQINLCVDAWDFKPAMYWQVANLVREYENAHK